MTDRGTRFEITPLFVISVIVGGVLTFFLHTEPTLRHTREHSIRVVGGFVASLLLVRFIPWTRRGRPMRFFEDLAFGAWMGAQYVVA